MTVAAFAAELAFARELADIAATISSRWADGDLGVRHKADATPVTDTDVAIERALREAVKARFPRDGFLGEEEGMTAGGRRTWVVDPIDGTRNLVDGIPLWSTLIAVVDDGRPVVGVVHAPTVHERYEAVVGRGATLNGRPIQVSATASLGEASVLHSGVEEWMRGPYWEGFCSVTGSARRTRGVSDAWGHMLVARGSADVLMEHEPCGPWDWSAVQVILEQAGGRLTTLEGAPPTPGCSLMSSNGALHGPILTGVRSPAADAVLDRCDRSRGENVT